MTRIALMLALAVLGGAPDAGRVGQDWGVERETYVDPVTGVRVTELATAGTSDNLYFHVSNFTADNRYVLFSSTRTGQRQFYRAEVETGRDRAVDRRSRPTTCAACCPITPMLAVRT